MNRVGLFLIAALLAWPLQSLAAETPALATIPAPAPAARTLLLVRHGHHSLDPVADPAQGPPLTAVGLDQAKLAAKRILQSGLAIDAVVASPMLRSQQTASAIVDALKGARLVTLHDLTECTPPMPPAQMTTLKNADELHACADQFDRVYDAYFRPAAGHQSAQILVAHANVIRYLVARALHMDPTAWQLFSLSHASLTTVRIEADGSMLVPGVGDIGHVPVNQRSGSVIDADGGGRRRR